MTEADLIQRQGAGAPLVSFLVIAYNQEQWIEEAVCAALSQDYPNLEVIIADDCSPDNTWQVINRVVSTASSGHKVSLLRNEENLGIGGNVSEALKRASGELIVLAAGDDVSSPDRVSKIVAAWLDNGRPAAVGSSLEVIDENGRPISISTDSRLANYNFQAETTLEGEDAIRRHYLRRGCIAVLGATLAYSALVFERFGVDLRDCHNEDLVLLGRALLLGGCLILPEKLIKHRVTGLNASAGVRKVIESNSSAPPAVGAPSFNSKPKTKPLRKQRQQKIELLRKQVLDVQKQIAEGSRYAGVCDELLVLLEKRLGRLVADENIASKRLIPALWYSIDSLGFRYGVPRFLNQKFGYLSKTIQLVRRGSFKFYDYKKRKADNPPAR